MVAQSLFRVAICASTVATACVIGGAGTAVAVADTGESTTQTSATGGSTVRTTGPIGSTLSAVRDGLSTTLRSAGGVTERVGITAPTFGSGNSQQGSSKPVVTISASTVQIRSPIPLGDLNPAVGLNLPGSANAGSLIQVSGLPLSSSPPPSTVGSTPVVQSKDVVVARPVPAAVALPPTPPQSGPPAAPVAPQLFVAPIGTPVPIVAPTSALTTLTAASLGSISAASAPPVSHDTKPGSIIGNYIRNLLGSPSMSELTRAALPGLAGILLLIAGGIAIRSRA